MAINCTFIQIFLLLSITLQTFPLPVKYKTFVGYMIFKKVQFGIRYLLLQEREDPVCTPIFAPVRSKKDNFYTAMGRRMRDVLGLSYENLMEIADFEKSLTDGEKYPKTYTFRIAEINTSKCEIKLSTEYKQYRWFHFLDAFKILHEPFRGALMLAETYLRKNSYIQINLKKLDKNKTVKIPLRQLKLNITNDRCISFFNTTATFD